VARLYLRHVERYPQPDPDTFSEFEKRYPPDRCAWKAENIYFSNHILRPWQELDEGARVWGIRQALASRSDNDQLERWNKTLDVLLTLVWLQNCSLNKL